jgi:hypothetical protein
VLSIPVDGLVRFRSGWRIFLYTTDVHEDELTHGFDVLWGGDEIGSGTDQDDSDVGMEEELSVSPSPSEDDIERQIRDEFAQWKHQTRTDKYRITEDYKIRIVTSSHGHTTHVKHFRHRRDF